GPARPLFAPLSPARARPQPLFNLSPYPTLYRSRPVAIHGDDFGFRLHRWSQNRFSAPSVHIRPLMTRPRPPRSRRSWLRAIIGPDRNTPPPYMAPVRTCESIGRVKIGSPIHQCN